MDNNKHPITPPPELRRLWAQQAQRMDPRDPVAWMQHVSTQAAQWGADQELKACCEHLSRCGFSDSAIDLFRAARRPTPQPEPEGLSEDGDVEAAAQRIYEAMRFERVETTPAWAERGNSFAQDAAREAARAVLNRRPTPQPPADGDASTVIPWLLEMAVMAANSDSPYSAGMLTLAAQLIGEGVDEDAPQPPADGEVNK